MPSYRTFNETSLSEMANPRPLNLDSENTRQTGWKLTISLIFYQTKSCWWQDASNIVDNYTASYLPHHNDTFNDDLHHFESNMTIYRWFLDPGNILITFAITNLPSLVYKLFCKTIITLWPKSGYVDKDLLQICSLILLNLFLIYMSS